MQMLFDDEFYSKTNHILDFNIKLSDTLHKQCQNLPKEPVQINEENAKVMIDTLLTTHVAALSGCLSSFAKIYFHIPRVAPFEHLVGVSSNLLTMLRQILILSIDLCYLSKTNLHADYYAYNRPQGKWSDKSYITRLDHGMSNLLRHSQFATPIDNQAEFTAMTKSVFNLIDDYRYCNKLVETYLATPDMAKDQNILKGKRNLTCIFMYVGICLLSVYEFSSVINTDENKLNEYWTTLIDYSKYTLEVRDYYQSL